MHVVQCQSRPDRGAYYQIGLLEISACTTSHQPCIPGTWVEHATDLISWADLERRHDERRGLVCPGGPFMINMNLGSPERAAV